MRKEFIGKNMPLLSPVQSTSIPFIGQICSNAKVAKLTCKQNCKKSKYKSTVGYIVATQPHAGKVFLKSVFPKLFISQNVQVKTQKY
jgi:hypothetical protein